MPVDFAMIQGKLEKQTLGQISGLVLMTEELSYEEETTVFVSPVVTKASLWFVVTQHN